MRIFALSDIHIDYEANAKWIASLCAADYRDDLLILAGDVSDTRRSLEWCLGMLAKRFRNVLFVPGNHELWVVRDERARNSLQKFDDIRAAVASSGASMETYRGSGVTIIPLFGWYDYSFGEPSDDLRSVWMDYRACRWPGGFTPKEIAAYFASLNDKHVAPDDGLVITYSHFLPRIDVMPAAIPHAARTLYPVLGSADLDRQLRRLRSAIHVYGHSHVNRRVTIGGVTYVNNAFGYPSETWSTSKGLTCIHEC